jgi:hypothetical protein
LACGQPEPFSRPDRRTAPPRELGATSYAAELGLYEQEARWVGPTAYRVGASDSEWAATLYLAQPIPQGIGGMWIVTKVGS